MTRYLLTIRTDKDRQEAARWASRAPLGWRVEFKEPKRTTEQNSLMWSLISQISIQREHHGRKYTPEQWKCIFMQALGQEQEFAPTLNGNTIFPLGFRSSELSKAEMTDLIEFILAWAAENQVKLRETENAA